MNSLQRGINALRVLEVATRGSNLGRRPLGREAEISELCETVRSEHRVWGDSPTHERRFSKLGGDQFSILLFILLYSLDLILVTIINIIIAITSIAIGMYPKQIRPISRSFPIFIIIIQTRIFNIPMVEGIITAILRFFVQKNKGILNDNIINNTANVQFKKLNVNTS